MSWLITLAKWICPNYFREAKWTDTVQLITIPYSHFCEFANWALHFNKIRFQERGYAPFQHVLPVLSVRVAERDTKFLSKSSFSAQLTQGISTTSAANSSLQKGAEEEDYELKKKSMKQESSAKATAVPLAITPDGQVFKDSWEIASYAFNKSSNDSSFPDDDFKSLLDYELGPLARQRAYSFLLLRENRDIFDRLCLSNTNWLIKILWHLYFGSYLQKVMGKMFKIHDKEACDGYLLQLRDVVKKLDSIIENRKGQYLGGDEIGIADIALASLFAPLVSPPLYCEGKYYQIFQDLIKRNPGKAKDKEYFTKTKTGEYVLELYSKHRLRNYLS